jgi:hypothetical protein
MTDLANWLRSPSIHSREYLEALCIEAADQIGKLREALEEIDNELNTAAQDDCENGVKWLNERAAEGYLKEYPCTLAAISEVHRIVRAVLGGDT